MPTVTPRAILTSIRDESGGDMCAGMERTRPRMNKSLVLLRDSMHNFDGQSRRDFPKAGPCALASSSDLLRTANALRSGGGAAVTPFTFHAPQSALDDLKFCLARTCSPDRETGLGWSQGVPLVQLRALLDYWRTDYDWRRRESVLNILPQYRTTIDGLGVHFLHVQSPPTNAMPLLISHGWPGSIIEFFATIDPLTNPTAHGGRGEDSFHLIAPSLPGFAFSDKPAQRGWNVDRIAQAWAELMRRLG
jgi:epoxide hydrolase